MVTILVVAPQHFFAVAAWGRIGCARERESTGERRRVWMDGDLVRRQPSGRVYGRDKAYNFAWEYSVAWPRLVKPPGACMQRWRVGEVIHKHRVKPWHSRTNR